MAKHVRGRTIGQKAYSVPGIEGLGGDRIPHSDKVAVDDPARSGILILLHEMESAGVEIDAQAVAIATKMGHWRLAKVLQRCPVPSGDVPVHQKSPKEAGDRQTWIYYVRIGNLIKIGTSMALATRFRAIRPNEVLALVPGGEQRENELHWEFAHLRVNGEYFHPGAALQKHVLALREEYGVPRWTQSLVPDGLDFFPLAVT